MSNLNLPNRITIGRVLLIPIFLVFALWQFPSHDFWAAVVFLVAAFSDTVDGRIARKRGLVTTLGKFLDPLADKMLVSSAYIALLALGRVPAWMIVLIICREFAVSGIRILAADAGVVIAASSLGKLKTATQMTSIVLLLLNGLTFVPQPFFNILSQVVLWLAVISTVVSGADYLLRGRQFFK